MPDATSLSGPRRKPRGVFDNWAHSTGMLILAATYGAVLSTIPQSGHFKDFDNYLRYAEQSWERMLWLLDQGILKTVANEPAWLLINATIGGVFSADTTVRIVIFSSATITAWLVLQSKRNELWILLIFLLLPIVIKNYIVHIRQGVGVSIFLIGWFSARRYLRFPIMTLAPLVHSSFFFILLLAVAARLMESMRLGASARIVSFALIGLAVSFCLPWVTGVLGARQGQEYNFFATEVSGIGSIVWFAVMLPMLAEGHRHIKTRSFEVGCIILYLTTYFFVTVSARIFESSVILVLLSGLTLTEWRRRVFQLLVVALGLGTWLVRIGQPAFGFGIP